MPGAVLAAVGVLAHSCSQLPYGEGSSDSPIAQMRKLRGREVRGSHSWEREGLGFKCTEFGSRSHLPNQPYPLAQGAPSLAPSYSPPSPLPTPATLNPAASPSGQAVRLEPDGWPSPARPGLRVSSLWVQAQHPQQPWLLFRK